MSPHRRVDLETRDRIAQLEARWQRVAHLMFVGGLAMAAGLLVIGAGFYIGFHRIQDSREESAFRACLDEVRGNAAIHRFVLARADVGTRDRLERELGRDFPTVPELVERRPGADTAAVRLCRRRAAARTGVTP